jgi:hypothetical protein
MSSAHADVLRRPVDTHHLLVVVALSTAPIVVVATVTEMMTVDTGAVMSAKETAVMTVVIDVEMMVGVTVAALTMAGMVTVAVLTALPLHMWTRTARYVPSMVIQLANAGGATQMIRRTEMMVERGHILLHMVERGTSCSMVKLEAENTMRTGLEY